MKSRMTEWIYLCLLKALKTIVNRNIYTKMFYITNSKSDLKSDKEQADHIVFCFPFLMIKL
jgi:hypothetical protein